MTKTVIKQGDYIIIDGKALFLARFVDDSCHIFSEDINNVVVRLKDEFPKKILTDIHTCVAGHDMELEDVDTHDIQWHGVNSIKLIV